MLKTIVVPLDGSELAERALSLATTLSIPTGARLVLVRVSPGAPPPDDVFPDGAYLAKTAADLRERSFCVDTALMPGRDIAQEILAAARQHHADLIVMTTHGRAGPARWVLGSVAETLVRCGQLPILLQRAWDPGRRAILLRDQPSVLVPVDGSQFAEAALPVALALAEDLGAEILLLRVDPDSRDIVQAEEDVDTSMNGQAYQPLVAIREYLDTLAASLRAKHPTIPINTRVECGNSATAIVAATEDTDAALVVMATHGRTGFERVALGSVADSVVRHGRAPIMLVRPTNTPVT